MHSQKEYEPKIQKTLRENEQIKQKLVLLRSKVSELRKEGRKQRRKTKALYESREKLRDKIKSKQLIIKGLKKQLNRRGKSKWHHYSTWLVVLSVLLRVKCNCSYENVSKIIALLNRHFELRQKRIPCANTIQNWVSKVGLFVLQSAPKGLLNQQISLIIDESIRLGKEKLLLVLACPWKKEKKGTLRFSDVEVVYMQGANSWKGQEIAKQIKNKLLNDGLKVMNVLSDEGNNLKNATTLLKLPHLPDIGHALAICLKQTFEKEASYLSLTKLIALFSKKGVNQNLSYLLPPKLGRKARFMNQQRWVDWAKQLLTKWRHLNRLEKAFFNQLREHRKMIATLDTCMTIAKKVAVPLKKKGLSDKTLKDIRKQLALCSSKNKYIKGFLAKIECYLIQYEAFLGKFPENNCIQVSSDIIESLFGKYKYRANNYSLTGLTKLNLEIPLYCKEEKEIIRMTEIALEQISITTLDKWVEEHSPDNQLVRKLDFRKK